MPCRASVNATNKLIESLPSVERKPLLKECELVCLTFHQILYEPNTTLHSIYFPLVGLISLMVKIENHSPVGVALIGNEGMLGATSVLGVNASPTQGTVQCEGTALRMPSATFRRLLLTSPHLQRKSNLLLYVLSAQCARSAGCAHFHSIEQRLACWFLMAHDRTGNDSLQLTHDFLAGTLGVRRSGITIAAGKLQRKKLISYVRGEIKILDRKNLQAESCDCYAQMALEYARLSVSN